MNRPPLPHLFTVRARVLLMLSLIAALATLPTAARATPDTSPAASASLRSHATELETAAIGLAAQAPVGGCPVLNFAPEKRIPLGVGDGGTTIFDVTTGDFNEDNKLDLAAVNTATDKLSVLLGDGTGGFSAPSNFTVGDTPESVKAADLDGDGHLDLVTANFNGRNVSVLLGDGTGSFGAVTNYPVNYRTQDVAIGDFDGNGLPDLIVAVQEWVIVSLLLNTGGGTFGPAQSFMVFGSTSGVAVGDFNHDQKLDAASATIGGNQVSVLLGDGAGGFEPVRNSPVGSQPESVAVADFNGDTNLDLVVANEISPGSLSVLLGDGAGNFSAATNYPTGHLTRDVVTGDFNLDNKIDLGATVSSGARIGVLLGDGAGAFGPATGLPVGFGPKGATAGDVNGDGRLDLVVANWQGNSISVLLNTCGDDTTSPSVTINKAAGQADQTSASPVRFTAAFNEPVLGFDATDVTISGSAGATTAVVTGGPSTYTIAVSGMTIDGTVVASIGAGVATDASGNGNTASTSTDNSVDFVLDDTPPVISPNISGTLGNNGWYTSNVSVSWTVSDDRSAISNTTGCAPATISSDTSGTTLTCTATSLGGTISKSVTVKRDAIAPTITFVSRTAPNANGWNNSAVTVNWTCSDATSGAVNASVSQTVSSEGANGSATGTCTDQAGNSASNSQTGISIDKTAPTLNPVVSPDPVLLNGSATATPNASDTPSGVASQSCGNVDTSSVGAKTVQCTATDKAGNTTTASASYRVGYSWSGFLQPVDNLPTLNVANAGRTIPLKWRLTDANGAPVTTLTSVTVKVTSLTCSAGATPDQIEEYATNASGLQNLGNGYYHFNWATPKSYANSCKTLLVDLGEGAGYERTALFQFK